jgi:hypothetical protein
MTYDGFTSHLVKKVRIIDVGFNEVNFAKGAEDWICYIEWGDGEMFGEYNLYSHENC